VQQPYLARVALALTYNACEAVPTVAVSVGGRLLVNEEFLASVGDADLPFLVEHECGHLLRHHAARANARDPYGWNIAGDAEINERTLHAPIEGCILPASLGLPGGDVAENYYRSAAGCLCPCSGGSGAGRPLPCEEPEPEPEVAQIERAVELAQADINHSPLASATRYRDIHAGNPSTPDWRKLLRRSLCRQGGDMDIRTWRRARNMSGVLRPRRASAGIVTDILIDVSASMSDADIADLGQVLRRSPIAAASRIWFATTEIVGEGHLGNLRVPDVTGGTDLGAAANCITGRTGRLLVITDGYTPTWPNDCDVLLVRSDVEVPADCRLIGVIR